MTYITQRTHTHTTHARTHTHTDMHKYIYTHAVVSPLSTTDPSILLSRVSLHLCGFKVRKTEKFRVESSYALIGKLAAVKMAALFSSFTFRLGGRASFHRADFLLARSRFDHQPCTLCRTAAELFNYAHVAQSSRIRRHRIFY